VAAVAVKGDRREFYIPLQLCFCATKQTIDEYRFTCVVLGAEALLNDLFQIHF